MLPLVTKPIQLPQLAQNSCMYCAGNGYIVVKTGSGNQQVQCSHCCQTSSAVELKIFTK